MDFEGILDQQLELAEIIKQPSKYVSADICGLDLRCGKLYIGEDFIATTNRRILDYYGGFEHVHPACITQVANLTIYSCEDDRVNDAYQTWANSNDI